MVKLYYQNYIINCVLKTHFQLTRLINHIVKEQNFNFFEARISTLPRIVLQNNATKLSCSYSMIKYENHILFYFSITP